MNAQQMELTFNGTSTFAPAGRRKPRLQRAQWFFEQMHKAVRNALQPLPPARPEQRRFALGGRLAWGEGYSASTARANSASVL